MNSSTYYKTSTEKHINDSFLYGVLRKYHYNDDDIALFRDAAKEITTAVKGNSEVEIIFNDYDCEVAFSLGDKVDMLIEDYNSRGDVLRQYIADNISSELMNKEYSLISNIIRNQTGKKIVQYQFYGGCLLDIRNIKDVLGRFKHINITCNEYMYLTPQKSVIFKAVLTGDENHIMNSEPTVCDTCEFGKNGKCINKMQ